MRFFTCNLQCSGFGQDDPTDPSTYDLPYEDFDVSSVNRIEDLPVWKKGCDSSYSWSKKFKHLAYQDTPDDICRKVNNLLKSNENPLGTFLHDKSGMETHMCFTGGEPLLPVNQKAIVDILRSFELQPGGLIPGTNTRKSNNLPRYVTFETNGTQALRSELINFSAEHQQGFRPFFSVSPKLYTVSGETRDKAIKPGTVASYSKLVNGSKGQLKFVVGDSKSQWDELEEVVDMFRAAGCNYPIWIMPVGARVEEQTNIAAIVSDMALERGYNVSARVHAYIYDNLIGK